jgi:hypothetical protein
VFLKWDGPGQLVGPNNSYVTTTNVGAPRYALWLSQLNVTYTPLEEVDLDEKTAYTIQPDVSTWKGDPAINGTMVNPQVAALAVYQAGLRVEGCGLG